MPKTVCDTLWDVGNMGLAINPKQTTNSHGVINVGNIPENTCKKIIDQHKNVVNYHVRGRVNEKGKFVENKKRDVDVWVIDESIDWIDHILISSVETAMEYLDYDIVGLIERPQLLRYKAPSLGYKWHVDLGAEELSTRKISISINLNDGYEGGEIAFFSDTFVKFKMPLGQCLAFPSFLSHKVMPVTKGERWALVSWISGNPFR
jgi:PKHD-type hydroxylase